MENAQVIGQRIKHYRKINSLTQKELAAEIGLGSSFIANIETGQKGVSVDSLINICRILHISLSDLYPIETKTDSAAKEKIIEEIGDSLRTMDTKQVVMFKTIVDGFSVSASMV